MPHICSQIKCSCECNYCPKCHNGCPQCEFGKRRVVNTSTKSIEIVDGAVIFLPKNYKEITKKINGGLNGIEHRKELLKKYLS